MRPWITLPLLAAISSIAAAEEGHRHHEAHVHGQAALNIVADGDQLSVQLETPAMNVLGFEHAATSKEDRKALEEVVHRLKDHASWLTPSSAAKCVLAELAIDSKLLEGEHDHDHDDHDEHEGHDDEHEAHDDHDDHKGHDDEHDHDDHDEHEGHDHDEEKMGQHSDFDVQLTYRCGNLGALTAIDTKGLFNQFPGMEDVDVQWIFGSRQSSQELSPKQTVVNFK